MVKKIIILLSVFTLFFSGCSNFLNSKLAEFPNFFQPSVPELSLEYLTDGNISVSIDSNNLSGTYEIERAEARNANGGLEFSSIAKDISIVRGGTSYVDDSTKPTSSGKSYWYRVRWADGESTSDYSEVKEVGTVLQSPTLDAVVTGETDVTLSITSPYDATYTIERALFDGVAGDYVLLESDFTATAGTSTYVDTTAYPTAEGISYLYCVQLNFRGEKSEYVENNVENKLTSPEISATLTNISEVTLNIKSSFSGTYRIERAETKDIDGNYVFTVLEENYTSDGENTTYIDRTVSLTAEGKPYAYRVLVNFKGNNSNYSETKEITTTQLTSPEISATLTNISEITLNIKSSFFGTYRIERAETKDIDGNYVFTVLEENYTSDGENTTYIDRTVSSVAEGKTYAYRVQVSFKGNNSNYSNVSSVFMPDYSSVKVENFSIQDKSNSEFTLSWDTNISFVTGYTIFYGTEDDIATAQSVSVNGGNTGIYTLSAESLVGYYFWIQPVFSGGKTGKVSDSVFGMMSGIFERSFNGTYTYTYNGSKPATVNAYLRGAGGGGQGGCFGYSDYSGGGGGGGAVTYVSFIIQPNSTITLSVGLGGTGGNYNNNSSSYYPYGYVGSSGEKTMLTYNNFTVSANGGRGGGSSGLYYGGAGGAALTSITNPDNITVLEFLREEGGDGSVGRYGSSSQTSGGTSPSLKGFSSITTGGLGGAEAHSAYLYKADGKNGKDGYAHLTVSVD